MSAIADFSVAVLDCRTCCRHFIESFVMVVKHSDRVACPHCGAHYVAPVDLDGLAGDVRCAGESHRHAGPRRGALHLLGQRRRRLQ